MRDNQPIKVIIDTNLWISFLIGQGLANLKSLIVSETIQLIVCDQLQEEIRRVTQRPKLRNTSQPRKFLSFWSF